MTTVFCPSTGSPGSAGELAVVRPLGGRIDGRSFSLQPHHAHCAAPMPGRGSATHGPRRQVSQQLVCFSGLVEDEDGSLSLLSSQGVTGPGAHGSQRVGRTGSRDGRPVRFSSSSFGYFALAGLRQVPRYLRNKYLAQKSPLCPPVLSLLHGPQSDTVEHKVVPMEALQTTDTTTTRAGQRPPSVQEDQSRREAPALRLSWGAVDGIAAPGEARPRTHCW